MSKHKIAIAGAAGRMGRMLIEATLQDDECVLVSAFDRAGADSVGVDAGIACGRRAGVTVGDDPRRALADADAVIDFTRPEATLALLPVAVETGTALVIGTTGFDDAGKAAIAAAAERVPVVFAPNMAVGVNAMFRLLEVAAGILNGGYDIEIVEMHHRHKVDAPSGTALRMGEVIAGALGRDLRECAIYGREGYTGERDPNTIAFSTLRGGDVVGDHTAVFAGTGERIEISHKSGGRMPYALGAIRAVKFLAGRDAGRFDMLDVLGLR